MPSLQSKLATISLSVLVSATDVSAQEQAVGAREVGNGVYSFTAGTGNHSMFVVGEESVAVFETFDSSHAQKLLDAVQSVTNKPVTYAFHSHNHWDHASGGQVFEANGAKTVMHDLAAQWVAANPGQDTATPTMIWDGDRLDMDMGGFTVEMRYLGLNHGLGLTIFTIPERKAAYIADLVTPNRVMFATVPDFNIGEWERSLGEVLELEFDIAVCSHNALPGEESQNGCTRQHVEEERRFIRDLRGAIIAEFQNGTNFFEIPQNIDLPQYADWFGYDDWLQMNAYRLMTDLFMGPFPWVPNAGSGSH